MVPAQSARPRPTIYDVAAEAGVSKSLVSLVLNGSDLVSEARRAAVQAAIHKLGYRPSAAAATLAAARSNTVGVLVDDYRNPWFVDLLDGLRQVLEPEGYHLTVAEQRSATTDGPLDGFLGSHVDALVIAAELASDHPDLGVPTVVVGSRDHDVSGADHFASDEAAGVRLLLDHLYERGHRRIGHVTGRGGSARRRLDAYLGWMRERGLGTFVAGASNETNEDGGYLGAAGLLADHDGLTALFAANDTMALGARAALRDAGFEVPRDLALAGYDNSLLARARFLDLTTVDNRNEELGVASGRRLLGLLTDRHSLARASSIGPRLVLRSSTATRIAG